MLCVFCTVDNVLYVCFTRVYHVLYVCFTRVYHVLYVCFTRVCHLLYLCVTRVYHVLYMCFTRVYHVLYCTYFLQEWTMSMSCCARVVVQRMMLFVHMLCFVRVLRVVEDTVACVNVVQCCTTLYNVVQCCAMLHNVVRCCTMLYNVAGEFCLVSLLMKRQPALCFHNFIESLFYFNAYERHSTYNKFSEPTREKLLFSLSGNANAEYSMASLFGFLYSFYFAIYIVLCLHFGCPALLLALNRVLRD